MLRFFISIVLTAALLTSAVYVGGRLDWYPVPTFFIPTLILLLLSTGVMYRYLHNAKSPAFFIQLYLATMVIKLLAYGVYNFFMILRDKASAVENVVFFMMAYFIFTAVEIAFLYRKMVNENRR